jgi:ABC-type multidrug transport system ATPase subunit
VGIIDHGKLIACGTLDDLKRQAAQAGVPGQAGKTLEELFLELTEGEKS